MLVTREKKKLVGRKGQAAWNIGLTKETNESLMSSSKKQSGTVGWNRSLTAKTDERVAKQAKGRTKPREIRYCDCDCGGIFECIVTSKKRFISGHNRQGEMHTKITKRKQRAAMLKRKEDLGYINSPENRKKTSESLSKTVTEQWKDPIYVKNHLDAFHRSPNKPEKFITKLLEKLLPKEYKFTGDGSFWIEKCNPDFINCNGQKKIIEFYGDYWHGNKDLWEQRGITEVNGLPLNEIHRRDKERLKTFDSYGYKTLVIWEHELQDIESLELKIKEFV